MTQKELEQIEEGELVALVIKGEPRHIVPFKAEQVRDDFKTYYWGGMDYDTDEMHKATLQDVAKLRESETARHLRALANFQRLEKIVSDR